MNLSMFSKKAARVCTVLILIFTLCITYVIPSPCSRAASYALVILSKYNATLKIGQSFYLTGFATNGKTLKWKSSKSSIASVNTYGKVTAKKAGTCDITAKVNGAESSCRITVQKTTISLSASSVSLECGRSYSLTAKVSTGHEPTFRTAKKSVATVSENGKIEAKKPGETTIRVSADKTIQTCKVIVKKPTVKLNQTKIVLSPKKKFQLTASVSSGRPVTWRSRKSSVAYVNDNGLITALKKGYTFVYAKVDGVTRECEVIVS